MKISMGDFVIIDNKEYQVLKYQGEIEFHDMQNPALENSTEYTLFELHLVESKSITPTHELHYYSDTKSNLFSISRSRDGSISLKNKQELTDEDITFKE